mmetsp:Transcript_23466/g.76304  ORF Transcript_23466/g.76304 Transcript_23466/m.76304 type:complete len:287 (-) Transcript_23466:852-1712(-)
MFLSARGQRGRERKSLPPHQRYDGPALSLLLLLLLLPPRRRSLQSRRKIATQVEGMGGQEGRGKQGSGGEQVSTTEQLAGSLESLELARQDAGGTAVDKQAPDLLAADRVGRDLDHQQLLQRVGESLIAIFQSLFSSPDLTFFRHLVSFSLYPHLSLLLASSFRFSHSYTRLSCSTHTCAPVGLSLLSLSLLLLLLPPCQSDGVLLCELACLCEPLAGTRRMKGWDARPRTRAASLHNIRKAISAFALRPSMPRTLMAMRAEDILDCDQDVILDLLEKLRSVYHKG